MVKLKNKNQNKKASNMNNLLEVSKKIYFSPLTLKITQIIRFCASIFFKFNYGIQIYFCYFSIPDRDKRGGLPDSDGRGRKILLTSI
jgi:hypothetical protein